MKRLQSALSAEEKECGSVVEQASELEDSVFATDIVDEIPSAFQIECPVCLQILRKPYQVNCCGKSICYACINKLLEESLCPCPCCKQKNFKTFHNKGLEQSINKLIFSCKYKPNGCEWTGGLTQRPDHIRECSKRPFTCNYCSDFMSDYDDVRNNHWPICGYRSVLCPNGCERSLQQNEIENHLENFCPQAIVDCDFKIVGCKKKLHRKDMPSHLSESLSTHIFLQLQSHKQLMLNHETENKILKQQNQKLQADVIHLQTQLKTLLKYSGRTTHLYPATYKILRSPSDSGMSSPICSIGDIDVDTQLPADTWTPTVSMSKGIVFSTFRTEQSVDSSGATVQGEGVRLIIPENAIKPSDTVNISIQACMGGQFVLPDDLVFESPVFLISPAYQFQREVTLVIEHFACIERLSDSTDMVFVSSPTKPKVMVQSETGSAFWEFCPHGKLCFSVDYSQGRVQLKHFCFGALAKKKNKSKKLYNGFSLLFYDSYIADQRHRYRVSLHMPLNFVPPCAHTIFSVCLLYTSPSPRDATLSRMPSSA